MKCDPWRLDSCCYLIIILVRHGLFDRSKLFDEKMPLDQINNKKGENGNAEFENSKIICLGDGKRRINFNVFARKLCNYKSK